MSAHTPELPEALRLAEAVVCRSRLGSETEDQAKRRRMKAQDAAAAELLRLHEVNTDLLDVAKMIAPLIPGIIAMGWLTAEQTDAIRAAIAKATGAQQ